MHVDKIVPLYRDAGKPEHIRFKITEVYTDTPAQTMIDLRRMVMTANVKLIIPVINIPGVGEVKDAPFIHLSPSAIMLVGDTWLATLSLCEPEKK